MKWWKVYFCFITLYVISVYLRLTTRPDALFLIKQTLTLLLIVSLYGFSFKKKRGSKIFWKSAFFICAMLGIIMLCNIFQIVYAHTILSVFIIDFVLTLAIVLPIFIAMYLYAFKCFDIWIEERV